MITKKLDGYTFVWSHTAFGGKGYWFLLVKNGGIGRAASAKEANKLGKPSKEETEENSVDLDGKSEYAAAAKVREKSFGQTIADRVLGGQGAIGAFGGAISDKFKARMTGIKEKFDPLNIARKLTGSGGAAILGSALGRKKSDISYFTGRKVNTKRDPFLTRYASAAIKDVTAGDTTGDVLSKLYSLIKKNIQDQKINNELKNNLKNASEDKEERYNEELIKAFLEPKKSQKNLDKQIKEAESKKTPSIKDKSTPKVPDTKPSPAPKVQTPKEPAKPSAPKAEPPKPPAPKVEPAKPAAPKAEPAKPAPEPAKPAAPKPEPAKPQAPKPEPAKPAPEPAKPTPKPEPAKPAPEPVKTTPSASTATKVAAASTGIVLSASAIASMKGEQSVTNVNQALATSKTDEVIKGKVSVPAGVPKLGAATADVKDSTSYGLFGINNIRAKDKKGNIIMGSSSIDSFVKMSPQLGLPVPGDNTDEEATKKFNEAWWKVSKENPEGMLRAQLDFFKKKFEDPAVEKIKDLPDNISKNPGVQLYMTDRRIQYGATLLDSALNYAKSAKTPEEFIRLISEFDRAHLREMFKSTSDKDFKKLEKGLENRVDTRKQSALKIVNNTGNQLEQVSQQNKDLKSQGQGSTTVINNTTNVVKQGDRKENNMTVDRNDSPAYTRAL